MKRPSLLAALALALLMQQSAVAAATVKPGGPCQRPKATSVVGKQKLVCVKVAGKLKWRAVTTPVNPRPSAPTTALSDATVGTDLTNCRIAAPAEEVLSAGFPRHPAVAVSGGALRIAVLKVTFRDAGDSAGTDSAVKAIVDGAASFYDSVSYGRFRLAPRFVTPAIPLTSSLDYYFKAARDVDLGRLMQDAIAAADPNVDFRATDAVVLALPSNVAENRAGVSPAMVGVNGISTADGVVITRGTVLAGDAYRIGPAILAHELGHLLGIPDYYAVDWNGSTQSFDEQFPYLGVWDWMNLAGREPLAWNRWLLSFLGEDQVRCISGIGNATFQLSPATRAASGVKLVVIPISATSAIGIESRRREGYDGSVFTTPISGGLIAYRVDTTRKSGNGPIQILRPTKSTSPVFADAVLGSGESLVTNGLRITNVESGQWGDVVRIEKVG